MSGSARHPVALDASVRRRRSTSAVAQARPDLVHLFGSCRASTSTAHSQPTSGSGAPSSGSPGHIGRLALGGALSDAALDYETIAMFGAAYFLAEYPDLLRARYKLSELPASAHELLVAIGKRRGGLRAGGVVDMQKASDILVHDFRDGALGRISLESPSMYMSQKSEPVDTAPPLDTE